MARIIRKPRSKYWFACFRDLLGRQHRKSTEQTDRRKALEVANHYELVAQHKIKPQNVRGTLSQHYSEIDGQTVSEATLRQFVEGWLKIKELETTPATLRATAKARASSWATWDLPQIATAPKLPERISLIFGIRSLRRFRSELSL
jgi:hypothetical protein